MFSRGQGFAKAAAVKKQRRLTREAVQEEEVETAPWGAVMVDVVFFFKTNRRRDQDNAVGSLKSAYDGIVDSGLVVDDTPEYMKRSMPDMKVDGKHPRVELTLTRIRG